MIPVDDLPVSGFDHHDPSFVADPHPVFAALRRCPVHRSEHHGGFWLLTRYADIVEAALDYERFTSSVVGVTVIPPSQPRDYPQIPIELDPPKHGLYRGLVSGIFTKQRVEQLRPELEDLAASLLQPVALRGAGELIEEFAVPMSVGTLGRLMRLPEEDQRLWVEWVRRMFENSIGDRKEQLRALAEFETYIDALIAERRRSRTDDFISLLLDAEIDGRRLSDREIRGFGILLLMAGHETTAGAMGLSLKLLGERPDLRRRLFSNRRLVTTAVNELLRVNPTIQVFCRNATRDLAVHGAEIAQGDTVALAYASGNFDPDAFADPDEVVLDRKPNRHLTFGWGHHLCLGANVARLEMAVMVETFSRLLPDFRLDPARPVRYKARGDVRGLASLHVLSDSARRSPEG